MFYYSDDGHWWLGDMKRGSLNWILAGGTGLAQRSYGNTVLKLTPALQVVSSFTPADQADLNANDWDFGSGGVLILPDVPSGPNANLLVTCGKDGDIFLLDRNNLGGYSPAPDNPNALFTLPLQPGVPKSQQPGVWGGPAYFDGPAGETVYYCGNGGRLIALTVSRPNGTLTRIVTSSPDTFPSEGGTTALVSSNGNAAGTAVVWAIARRDAVGRLHLRAYDAADLSRKLVDLDCGPWANSQGGAFLEPTVAAGKVYVGSDDHITVFGL
jgi:hypothetical protein